MSNKIKILLTVSLVLNFLFIGILIGQFSSEFMKYRNYRAETKRSIEKLPEEKAMMLKQTRRKLHKETKGLRKEIRNSRKNIYKIITAPTFDENSYDSEVKKLHELSGQIMSYLTEATKELAADFTMEEREVIAEILRQREFRPHHRGHRPGIPAPEHNH